MGLLLLLTVRGDPDDDVTLIDDDNSVSVSLRIPQGRWLLCLPLLLLLHLLRDERPSHGWLAGRAGIL